jgi:hypothetical protein
MVDDDLDSTEGKPSAIQVKKIDLLVEKIGFDRRVILPDQGKQRRYFPRPTESPQAFSNSMTCTVVGFVALKVTHC